MTVQGALRLGKRLSLNVNFSFLNWTRYFSYQVATQLSLRGRVDPVPDLILPEKFLGYSRESNPGPLGWQSDVITTIPWVRKSRYCGEMLLSPIHCCDVTKPLFLLSGELCTSPLHSSRLSARRSVLLCAQNTSY